MSIFCGPIDKRPPRNLDQRKLARLIVERLCPKPAKPLSEEEEADQQFRALMHEDGEQGWFGSPFEEEMNEICEAADGLPIGAADIVIGDALANLYREHGFDYDDGTVVFGENFAGHRKHRPSERSIALTVHSQRERTRRLSLETTLTPEQWARVLTVHDNRCVYCGSFGRLAMDHLVPVAKGGGTTVGNVVPACASCNSSKGKRDLLDWLALRKIDESDLFVRLGEARHKLEEMTDR